ncbi:hypothetical protein PV325_011619 [Microctonus aethiopoides]|uniref:Uncharacterized protein n=1 Tax=Microctonus aethiopoides TaxID=144406 RepID=A0AA39F1G9_9HYME|nr:hypothetical protein PV326_014306 [Microctonus aethiopoides]KAK0081761.1 hypothetical protein PV325_011619 [Microctonus aethiopoides]KAK0160003.1 hypothetical protein PV328_007451 [Microctonus aethiopoides]
MSTNKFIMLTIVAYFGVYGLVLNCINAEEITVDQLTGYWYTVAIISPLLSKVSLRCDRRNITRGTDDDTFNDVHTVITDSLHTYNGVGKIKDSELHITYPAFGPGYVDIQCIKSYNNGDEFILHKAKPKQSQLRSRKPTASDEVKMIFEKEAADANATVKYIDQDNC